MEREIKLWDKELWTQNEVALYFRVVPGTVKNWREQGILNFWQAPGSSRVLFHRDDIKACLNEHTFPQKGGEKERTEIKVVKPSISSKKKNWRI